MVNLSRILKSLAIEHSVAVVVCNKIFCTTILFLDFKGSFFVYLCVCHLNVIFPIHWVKN